MKAKKKFFLIAAFFGLVILIASVFIGNQIKERAENFIKGDVIRKEKERTLGLPMKEAHYNKFMC